MMKFFITFLILLIASGCTSLKPIDLPPEQLQQKITAEDIVKVGQRVKIVTSDGITHEFKVTEIRDDRILGEENDIPIKEIIALQTREFSGGKTAALVSGIVIAPVVIICILFLILPVSFWVA